MRDALSFDVLLVLFESPSGATGQFWSELKLPLLARCGARHLLS